MAERALWQGMGEPGHFPEDFGLVVRSVELVLRQASEKRPPTRAQFVPKLSNLLSFRKPWVGLAAEERQAAKTAPRVEWLSDLAAWHVLDQQAAGALVDSYVCVDEHVDPNCGNKTPETWVRLDDALARVQEHVKRRWNEEQMRVPK